MTTAPTPCLALAVSLLFSTSTLLAQRQAPNLTPEERQALVTKRESIESELEKIAIIDRKVMVPMRDGKRMAADIYRPKDTSKKYPIIFSRTPYNFNFWVVHESVRRVGLVCGQSVCKGQQRRFGRCGEYAVSIERIGMAVA